MVKEPGEKNLMSHDEAQDEANIILKEEESWGKAGEEDAKKYDSETLKRLVEQAPRDEEYFKKELAKIEEEFNKKIEGKKEMMAIRELEKQKRIAELKRRGEWKEE